MKYEVYENSGGAVVLAILNDDLAPVAIFENWEYGPRGILADALQQLSEDPAAWEVWDGDLTERLATEWPLYHAAYGNPLTVAELYAYISDNDDLIIDADGDMVDVSRMGYAAREALGLPEDDEA